jgi:hypothetical protein
VPPEPEASLAEYNVSAGDPVQDTTIQPTAPDKPNTAVPTDEPQDYQQPEPPTASGHNDEEARTEDPVSAPSTSPQLPPASSRPIRYRRPPDRLNLYSIFHMTAKRALREDPATARPAIEAQCKHFDRTEHSLVDKGLELINWKR